MDDSGIVLVLLIGICLYFIPSIIGFVRGSPYAWVIFVLNLLGGWTVVAWFAALIWALWPKGRSAASFDVNLNHRGSIDVGPAGYQGYGALPYEPRVALPNPGHSKLDELERLAHLRTIGAISLDEFEQQKAQVLRG